MRTGQNTNKLWVENGMIKRHSKSSAVPVNKVRRGVNESEKKPARPPPVTAAIPYMKYTAVSKPPLNPKWLVTKGVRYPYRLKCPAKKKNVVKCAKVTGRSLRLFQTLVNGVGRCSIEICPKKTM